MALNNACNKDIGVYMVLNGTYVYNVTVNLVLIYRQLQDCFNYLKIMLVRVGVFSLHLWPLK
jgi:hypothetical protein